MAHRGPWLTRWAWRHRGWCTTWLILGSLTWLTSDAWSGLLLFALALLPGLIAWAWSRKYPISFEVAVARPDRRMRWWWHARIRWKRLARVCGLSDRQAVHTRRGTADRYGRHGEQLRWVAPILWRVKTRSHTVELLIRTRPGQTLEELERGSERIATTLGAVAHRVQPISGATLKVHLVMTEALATPAQAKPPVPVQYDAVRLGRTQTGGDWWLPIRGRHTLVAGCSGSGKGSVLWGICGALAPAANHDLVRLWGIDLKRGVELAMGEDLFCCRAYRPDDAVDVLKALMGVIDKRGAAMAGTTRLHQPSPGDPLHVLVIDELAALTAYADLDIRREANRLLAEILTQGRALGVVVLACVQDPRKDVVAMRGLFTQTIALRLRSTEETVMVLGDGMSQRAPAHRVNPTRPGTGWVIDDEGAADRVRADFWSDAQIRAAAKRYGPVAQVLIPDPTGTGDVAPTDLPRTAPAPEPEAVPDAGQDVPERAPRPRRKPRSPRASTRARQEGQTIAKQSVTGGAA
ncbi:MAG: cell division protein FtsK [Nocardioidaceae bacterium]|nr:cell division protein FtsK [Nocardioidaceae bacterium]NUS52483.1 cell division protein FtsK [Nocardioidaceae bacterium]